MAPHGKRGSPLYVRSGCQFVTDPATPPCTDSNDPTTHRCGPTAAGTTAIVPLSAPPLRPTLFPAAGACTPEIDPNEFVVLATLPINHGGFGAHLPLANDPYLYGLRAALQAVIAPTDGMIGVDFNHGSC